MRKTIILLLVFVVLFCSTLVKAGNNDDATVLFVKNLSKTVKSVVSKAKTRYNKAKGIAPKPKSGIVKGPITASRLQKLIRKGAVLTPRDILARFRVSRTLNVRVSPKGTKFFKLDGKWYRAVHAGKWDSFKSNEVYSVCVVGPTSYTARYDFKYNRRLTKVLKNNEQAQVWADLGLDTNIKITRPGKIPRRAKTNKAAKRSNKVVKAKRDQFGGKCYTKKQYKKLVNRIQTRYGSVATKQTASQLFVDSVPLTKTEQQKKKRCRAKLAKQRKCRADKARRRAKCLADKARRRAKCLAKKAKRKCACRIKKRAMRELKRARCQLRKSKLPGKKYLAREARLSVQRANRYLNAAKRCGCPRRNRCAAKRTVKRSPVRRSPVGKCPVRAGANLRFKGNTTLNVKKLVIRQ